MFLALPKPMLTEVAVDLVGNDPIGPQVGAVRNCLSLLPMQRRDEASWPDVAAHQNQGEDREPVHQREKFKSSLWNHEAGENWFPTYPSSCWLRGSRDDSCAPIGWLVKWSKRGACD